jgi:hypothetical protein
MDFSPIEFSPLRRAESEKMQKIKVNCRESPKKSRSVTFPKNEFLQGMPPLFWGCCNREHRANLNQWRSRSSATLLI